jgi:hypothetical protein
MIPCLGGEQRGKTCEHTSLKHAWIEGSIESGIRTALEVAGLANLVIPAAVPAPHSAAGAHSHA